MHDEVKPEHLLSDAVRALADSHIALSELTRRWHRENEDRAIRDCLGRIEHAGMCLVAFRKMITEGQKDIGLSGAIDRS